MLKKYIGIGLYNKLTNTFDKKIKEKLFSNDNQSNLTKILNDIVNKELSHYIVESNNKNILCSKFEQKQLYLSDHYFSNSFDYSHSFIYFYDKNYNIPLQELEYISNKLKFYFEKYLNYEIMKPTIFEENN